jgi:hypothetical protein
LVEVAEVPADDFENQVYPVRRTASMRHVSLATDLL